MTDLPPRRRALVGGLLFALFSALFLHTAWEKSPTWDEVGYLGLGAYLLQTGRWDVPAAASHPPLAYYLHDLPTFLFPVDWSAWRAGGAVAGLEALQSADVGRGNALLLDPHYDGELLLLACRATSLVLAALLALVLYRWGSRLGGARGGLAALFFMALSPNLLAHAPLVTTDFAVCALFATAVYALRSLLLAPSGPRAVAAGLAAAGAALAKLSGILIVPLGALLAAASLAAPALETRDVFGAGSARSGWRRRPWAALAGPGAIAAAAAAAAIWVAYGMDPRPYLDVFRSQLHDLGGGHRAYLMGSLSTRGWWYYYPVALALKTPIPTMLLAAAGAVGLWRRGPAARLELAFLAGPVAVFAAAFTLSPGKDIGVRYLLPVYPFLYVLAGQAASAALDLGRAVASPGRWRAIAAAGLCAWYAVGTLSHHPHHLAYFNELAGGPRGGHRYLVDSNLDWGQDLKGLKRYMDERGVKRIALSYFGTVDPALYGLEYDWLPSYLLPRRPTEASGEPPQRGLVAVSVTNLAGVYLDLDGSMGRFFDRLRRLEPVATIGYSICVYDLDGGSEPTP